jgi:hypothetical protein
VAVGVAGRWHGGFPLVEAKRTTTTTLLLETRVTVLAAVAAVLLLGTRVPVAGVGVGVLLRRNKQTKASTPPHDHKKKKGERAVSTINHSSKKRERRVALRAAHRRPLTVLSSRASATCPWLEVELVELEGFAPTAAQLCQALQKQKGQCQGCQGEGLAVGTGRGCRSRVRSCGRKRLKTEPARRPLPSPSLRCVMMV